MQCDACCGTRKCGKRGKTGVCAAATGFAMMAVARIILGLAVFAVCAGLSIPFVARCGPETYGRSLEEIERDLVRR